MRGRSFQQLCCCCQCFSFLFFFFRVKTLFKIECKFLVVLIEWTSMRICATFALAVFVVDVVVAFSSALIVYEFYYDFDAGQKETYRLSLMETFKSKIKPMALAIENGPPGKMRTGFWVWVLVLFCSPHFFVCQIRRYTSQTLHFVRPTLSQQFAMYVSVCVYLCVCIFHKPSAEVHKLHWQFNDVVVVDCC